MTFKPFSLDKYLFIMTLTVSTEQFEKANLFKPNTPQRQKHRFVSHSPYCPVVRLDGPRAYIRTPLYVADPTPPEKHCKREAAKVVGHQMIARDTLLFLSLRCNNFTIRIGHV